MFSFRKDLDFSSIPAPFSGWTLVGDISYFFKNQKPTFISIVLLLILLRLKTFFLVPGNAKRFLASEKGEGDLWTSFPGVAKRSIIAAQFT
jgi:hypothetical protein